MSTESFGLAILLASAILYSGMGIFLQLAAVRGGFPSTQLVCLRATFQGSLVVAAMCWTRHSDDDSLLIWRPLGNSWAVQRVVLLRGAVGGLGFLLYFYTLTVLPLGDAVALSSLKSVVTIVLGWLVLGEAVRPVHMGVAVTSIVGAVLVAKPTFLFGHDDDDNAPPRNATGYFTALLGCCTAASVLILIRKAGAVGAHTLQLLFSWAMFGLLFSLVGRPLIESHNHGKPWIWPSSTTAWSYVAAMCMIGSVGHFLLNFAGKLAPAGPASITRSSDMVFAYLWEHLVFHQVVVRSTVVGVVLIATSVVWLGIDKIRHEQQEQQRQQQQYTHLALPACEDEDDEEDAIVDRVELATKTPRYFKVASSLSTAMDGTEEESSSSDDDNDDNLSDDHHNNQALP